MLIRPLDSDRIASQGYQQRAGVISFQRRGNAVGSLTFHASESPQRPEGLPLLYPWGLETHYERSEMQHKVLQQLSPYVEQWMCDQAGMVKYRSAGMSHLQICHLRL